MIFNVIKSSIKLLLKLILADDDRAKTMSG